MPDARSQTPATGRRRPRLNADIGLSRPDQVRWLAGNAAAAVAGEFRQAVERRPPPRSSPAAVGAGPLRPQELAERAGPAASPGRLLSVHLTRHVCGLADRLAGRPVRVLDLGCGTGGFVAFFRRHVTEFSGYTGVDVYGRAHWPDHAGRGVEFVVADAEAFTARLTPRDDYALVYSNSALEHMSDDLAVAHALGEWSRQAGRPVVQLHIVPATAALTLYRLHGHRVYSGHAVRRLAAEFAPARVRLVALGGARSWLLHLKDLGLRDHEPEAYRRRLEATCARDAAAHAPVLPIFWAILALPG